MQQLTMLKNPRTSAAIYLRISRDFKGDGLAIDRQREACMKILEQRGWALAKEYVDESISAYARDVKRPGYARLVSDYELGHFTAIVCYDLDRLTRQPRQLEDWIDASEDHGLQLVTANGEADLSTDGGRMYARIKSSVARAESERKGARQRAAAEQRAKLGKPPLGVRLTGYDTHGNLIPDEAAIIKEIFARFLRGESLRGIARILTVQGTPTRKGGTRWNPSTIQGILRNPRYAGHGKYYDEVLKSVANWPAIVSPADFDLAQIRLDDPARKLNRTGTDRKYLGSGLFLCGVCKESVSSFSGLRYSCKTGHGTRSIGPIDELVIETIAAYLQQARLTPIPPMNSAHARELEAQALRARERLVTIQNDYDEGLIDGRRFKAANDRAEAELALIDRERANLFNSEAAVKILTNSDPVELFRNATLMEKRAIIDALLEVHIFPGKQGVKSFDPESVAIKWKGSA